MFSQITTSQPIVFLYMFLYLFILILVGIGQIDVITGSLCLVIVILMTLYSFCKTNKFEHFNENIPLILKELQIESIDEAKAILDMAWNENIDSIGHKDFTKHLILYYSCFSRSSRNELTSIPYVWNNISSYYLNNHNESCSSDDTRIVFSNNP